MLLWNAQAETRGIHPNSANSILFIESEIPAEAWAPYRVVEPQKPAVFQVEGPGRLLLRLRGWGDAPSDSIAVVLRDERVILSAKIEPKPDPTANVVNAQRPPSIDVHYLLWIEPGRHRVAVRYSDGGSVFVLARYTPLSLEDWRLTKKAQMLAPTSAVAVDSLGALRSEGGGLAASPDKRSAPRSSRPRPWFGRLPKDDQEWDLIFLGARARPPSSAPHRTSGAAVKLGARASPQGQRSEAQQASKLHVELAAGAVFNRIGRAPVLSGAVRVPLADTGLSVGGAAEFSFLSTAQPLTRGSGVTVDVGRVAYTWGVLGAELVYTLSAGASLEPYGAVSMNWMFGRFFVTRGEQRQDASAYGPLAGLRVGLLVWRGLFLELRGQAGSLLLRSDTDGPSPLSDGLYLAGSAQIGYRWELEER